MKTTLCVIAGWMSVAEKSLLSATAAAWYIMIPNITSRKWSTRRKEICQQQSDPGNTKQDPRLCPATRFPDPLFLVTIQATMQHNQRTNEPTKQPIQRVVDSLIAQLVKQETRACGALGCSWHGKPVNKDMTILNGQPSIWGYAIANDPVRCIKPPLTMVCT